MNAFSSFGLCLPWLPRIGKMWSKVNKREIKLRFQQNHINLVILSLLVSFETQSNYHNVIANLPSFRLISIHFTRSCMCVSVCTVHASVREELVVTSSNHSPLAPFFFCPLYYHINKFHFRSLSFIICFTTPNNVFYTDAIDFLTRHTNIFQS